LVEHGEILKLSFQKKAKVLKNISNQTVMQASFPQHFTLNQIPQ